MNLNEFEVITLVSKNQDKTYHFTNLKNGKWFQSALNYNQTNMQPNYNSTVTFSEEQLSPIIDKLKKDGFEIKTIKQNAKIPKTNVERMF